MPGPSRLYRAFPGTRPLFVVSTAEHSWSDSGIESITIRHGKDSAEWGLHPSTAEVRVAGPVGLLNDRDVTIRMSTPLQELTAAEGVRFTGRVATQETVERPRLGRPPRMTSVLSCSSWSSVYLASGRVSVLSMLQPLDEMFAEMWGRLRSRVGKTVPLVFRGNWRDYTFEYDKDSTLADHVGKFYGDYGYLFRQRRDGTLEGLGLEYRVAQAETAAASAWPLMQSHVIGETSHRQDIDIAGTGIKLDMRRWSSAEGKSTVHAGIPWDWPGAHDDPPYPYENVLDWQTYDWTHIAVRDEASEQYRYAINAISSRTFRTLYATPSVTIDVLHLLTSSLSYERTVGRQLLNLTAGDPVVLGGDWEKAWAGIFYAEQITERITPDGWTLELALYPATHVAGVWGRGDAPTVRPRTWAQARQTWSSAGSRTWSN